MDIFSVEIPHDDEEAMKSFCESMDLLNQAMIDLSSKTAKELNVSDWCADNILYLRSRSRWTQEKENYLIWLDQHNMELPNFNDDFDVPDYQ
jgi:hypothetical protein